MNIFRFLTNLAKPKTNLSKAYAPNFLPKAYVGLASYPKKDFMSEEGVHAYRLQFMVSAQDAKRVIELIAANFNLRKQDTFQEGDAKGSDGSSIHFSIRHEFNGAVIELVTNAIPFLLALDKLYIKPPAPWLVFPNVDPETLGGRQGSIDYWWTWFWSPFWDSASKVEKAQFLEENNASAEWAEYINAESE